MIDCALSLIAICVISFISYKLLDRLLRIPFLSRKGRYIFITGCDRGFGYEIALRLDRRGCHVFAGCLTEDGETGLQKACSSRLITLPLDVTKPDSVRKAFNMVTQRLPTSTGLWGIVNNAGTAPNVGPTDWLCLQDYHDGMAVNTWGMIDVTMTFLPLIKQSRGRVVNMSSILGRTCRTMSATYCVSKYAVEAFSDILRLEMRNFGCTVHLVEPGFFQTQLTAPESRRQRLDKVWNSLDQAIKDEYGQDFYRKLYAGTSTVIGSRKISDVIGAYEHALLGMYPRARYVVGWDATYFWLPVQWLPEWLGGMIHSYMGYTSPRPA